MLLVISFLCFIKLVLTRDVSTCLKLIHFFSYNWGFIIISMCFMFMVLATETFADFLLLFCFYVCRLLNNPPLFLVVLLSDFFHFNDGTFFEETNMMETETLYWTSWLQFTEFKKCFLMTNFYLFALDHSKFDISQISPRQTRIAEWEPSLHKKLLVDGWLLVNVSKMINVWCAIWNHSVKPYICISETQCIPYFHMLQNSHIWEKTKGKRKGNAI